MMGLWLLVPAPIRRALAWAAAGCIAVFAVWTAGKREARQEARTDALRGYVKTRKDIDDATDHLGSDPAVLRDWLSERGKSKRDL